MSAKQDRINAYWAEVDGRQGTYTGGSSSGRRGGAISSRRAKAEEKREAKKRRAAQQKDLEDTRQQRALLSMRGRKGGHGLQGDGIQGRISGEGDSWK